MQSLTSPPRDGLTTEAVTALLQSPNLSVDFGAELLAADLTFVEDITADLAGGSVSRNMNNRIHGTCKFLLSRELTWGVDLVRLYMTLSDGAIVARWNVGVFCPVTPDRKVGETPETFDVQGYDRLMLLDRYVGADYTVAAGTTYRAALLQAFTDAGLSGVLIEGSAADDTLPAAKTWPLVAKDQSDPDQTNSPVTWLRVVNDLLRPIRFRSVWANQDGTFVCQSYQQPSERAPEAVFDADSILTVLGEDRTITQDVWATPNRWVFRNTSRPSGAPAPTEGDGIYTVDQSDKVNGDWLGRTLVWTDVIDYEAATQAKLVSLGNDRVAADKRATTRVEATTGPWPGAGHWDVVKLVDAVAGINGKAQAVEWQMPLDGGDVQWVFEMVQ